MNGHAMTTDSRYLLVIFLSVWLWKMVVRQILSWEVHKCMLFQRAARESRIVSNTGDILTKVMHVYSTGGLTCYWRIRGNE